MKKNLKTSKEGAAAIEFAILLPFLLIVFFGVYQVATYVQAVRKIDNVTNDIAYILSRQGNIATNSGGTYVGGKDMLNTIVQNTVPFLMFPYNDNLKNNQMQVEMAFYGLPQFPAGACPGGKVSNIDYTNARIMWTHDYPARSTVDILDTAVPPASASGSLSCTGSACPLSCAGTPYLSTWSDWFGDRASIIYPGQSFVMVWVVSDFKTLLGQDYPGIGADIMPKLISKASSYAVRSRIQDLNNNGIIESNELFNFMQYCTDCNVATSAFKPSGGGQAMNAGNPALSRQSCKPDALISNANGYNNNDANTGGCSFF